MEKINEQSVLCEEKDNICLITLNEEDTRNAISRNNKELVSILEEIDNNKNISCAILTETGKVFLCWKFTRNQ